MKQAQPLGCACFFICFVKHRIYFDIVGATIGRLIFYTPILSCTVSITLNATPERANHKNENGTQT